MVAPKKTFPWWIAGMFGVMVVAAILGGLLAMGRDAPGADRADVIIRWTHTMPGATIGVLTNNRSEAIGPITVDAAYDEPQEKNGFALGTAEVYCQPSSYVGVIDSGRSLSVMLNMNFNLVKRVRVRERGEELSVKSVIDLDGPPN